VVFTLQAALAAQPSQLDQVLNELAIQQARMTPTIADTITETVDLSALTAQAALSSQALVELLKRTSSRARPAIMGIPQNCQTPRLRVMTLALLSFTVPVGRNRRNN